MGRCLTAEKRVEINLGYWTVIIGDVCKLDALFHNQNRVSPSRLFNDYWWDEVIICKAAESSTFPLKPPFSVNLMSVVTI